jgi:3-oxoacyl-(acyl-carrier-protein) synthase/3-hydroxymyristoyl/3-hydroxydecanoyl-(acyl carrier protein) dehydratase
MNKDPAIAIVGMGGVFPGAASLDDFWRNIVAARNMAREVPEGRWVLDPREAYSPEIAPDKVYSLRGCFVEDFQLDPSGLQIDRELLKQLDPLYHLVLHAGRDAFNSARTEGLDRSRVGVILAAIALPTDFASAITRDIVGRAFAKSVLGEAADRLYPTGPRTHPLNSKVVGLPAALLAKSLGLGGSAYTLDAACASSLYALKLACDELIDGRADAMLAGGASRPDCLYTQMGFSQLRALSPSGRCAPFDAASDGLVVGEGAGLVMLKRLDDALAAGDHVYAVIRGIGLSNDIGGSLLAPDSEGQLRAMRQAYEQAGWTPDDLDLIECHGTGTPIGDGVEIASLRRFWEENGAPTRRCPIGSIKSMIGHLLTGAGAAGLIKVLLGIEHGTLPPSANFERGGSSFALEKSPFFVQTGPTEWTHRDARTPRRAAISAFGFGGINAHVLVEEYFQNVDVLPQSKIQNPKSRSEAQIPARRDQVKPEPIAIIGLDARFGHMRGLDDFHVAIQGDRDARLRRPAHRWMGLEDHLSEFDEILATRGDFADRLCISVGRYRLPPNEISEILPQQLVMLESVAAALQDAGMPLREKRPRTGAFIGMAQDFEATQFQLRWWLAAEARRWAEALGYELDDEQLADWLEELRDAVSLPLNATRTLGALGGMIASRIAREFQFGGPCFGLSCDEHSGLRAIQIAARAMANGEIDSAIVGAVDMTGDLRAVWSQAELNGGSGGPIAEGAAAMVLKRLSDARRDGDRIHAILENASGNSSAWRLVSADGSQVHDGLISIETALGHCGAAAGMASLVATCLKLDSEARGMTDDVEATDDTAAIIVPIGRRIGKPRLPVLKRISHTEIVAGPPRMASSSRVQIPTSRVLAPLLNSGIAAEQAVAKAHESFLRFSQTAQEGLASVLAIQTRLVEQWGGQSSFIPPNLGETRHSANPKSEIRNPELATLLFDRRQCMEFAVGRIANVLGEEFAIIDSYPVRVRLPDEPLMLCDRILSVEGERGSLGSGRLITEHDVLPGDWYLDMGRCPVSISVESGQADLFLCSYLGIDFVAKGMRSYRLLDAAVTFHRGLPQACETIRYDIRIDRFVRQGETYLFFFEFDGTIDGQPVLTMRNGCAGFFTKEEVRNSHGIVLTAEDRAPATGKITGQYEPLFAVSESKCESYDDHQIDALRRGDLAGCFGPTFSHLSLRDPPRLPGGRMTLIHRVVELEPSGGRFGLGRIVAEADVQPDDWYLTCHFVDDMVMPGTLMYECCVHTLRFFLMRIGWLAERDTFHYEPVIGVCSTLRCRGPVTPETKMVTYELHIKEIGYRPVDAGGRSVETPYVLADALMYADGERIVQMNDMSLQLTGLSREKLEQVWATKKTANKAAIFNREHILAFAIGKPSEAFGAPYAIFDSQRRIARLPGPPYAFIDRIVEIEPQAWKLEPGGWIEAEYDVPPDAWYFTANRQRSMPFAVLLEIALQPCGWLAAYLGSALTSETDLSFRNLGGRATLHEEIFPESGMLSTRVRMTSVSQAGGMIIEKFDMEMRCSDRLVYSGDTSFGFFSAEALARQVGVRDAGDRRFAPSNLSESLGFTLPDEPPFTPDAAGTFNPKSAIRNPQSLALPGRALRMIDQIDVLLPDCGPHGLGFIKGSTTVDPTDWFFKAHFYQDPVWPGSLGLESFVQLLKTFALNRWPQLATSHRFEPIAVGLEHEWIYRGQIIPRNKKVEVEAVITQRAEGASPLLIADGFLSVDGITIYEMKNFGLRLVPA